MPQSEAFLAMQNVQARIENVFLFSKRMNKFQLEVLSLLEKNNNKEARTLLENQVQVLTKDLAGAGSKGPYKDLLLQQIEEFKQMIARL